MPRWASRITLEIVSLRAERLQEISEQDAIAEGIKPLQMRSWRNPEVMITQSTAVEEFARLWNSLNPTHPWENNDWVWVIGYRLLGQSFETGEGGKDNANGQRKG